MAWVAHAVNVVKAGDNGQRSTQRPPIPLPKLRFGALRRKRGPMESAAG